MTTIMTIMTDVTQVAKLSMVIHVRLLLQVYVLKFAETGSEPMRRYVMTEIQQIVMDVLLHVL